MSVIAMSGLLWIYYECWQTFLSKLIYDEPERVDDILEKLPVYFHMMFRK
jgi:hypothetical protein